VDDHRSIITAHHQSLHGVSAASFLIAYALLFVFRLLPPWSAALVSMTTRQAVTSSSSQRVYDHVNHAGTHDHKEEIKGRL